MKSKEKIEQEIDFLKSKIEEIGQPANIHEETSVSIMSGYVAILKWVLKP